MTSDIQMTGSFSIAGYEHLNDYIYNWDQAYFSLGVSDNKGIREKVEMNFNKEVIVAQPGAGQTDLFERGISFPVAIDTSTPGSFSGDFSINLGSEGKQQHLILPCGEDDRGISCLSMGCSFVHGHFPPG